MIVRLLVLLGATIVACEAVERPFSTTAASDGLYSTTTNPGASDGYTDARATAFWKLNYDSTTEKFPSTPTSLGSPPDAIAFAPSSTVYSDDGIQAHPNATTPLASDKSLRLNGRDENCLKASTFGSPQDVCLANPAQCSLIDSSVTPNVKGLSFSFWVNMPQEFMPEKRYLIDTGGNEFGNPGVAVYFTGSTDGMRFTHQLTVLVSTGPKFWKVVLNGMVRPYSWNNVGVRWSGDAFPDSDPNLATVPRGLEVYVNNTRVAAKYYETADLKTTTPTVSMSDLTLTIGCMIAGTNPFLGKMDNLAIWYWYVRDTEIAQGWFTGGLSFLLPVGATDITSETGAEPSGNPVPYNALNPWRPWQYEEEMMRLQAAAAADTLYLDDTTMAVEGDCLVGDTSTWGDGGDDGVSHPVDCADTRTELQSALELDDKYSGHELVKAIIRTVNRAGPNGLSEEDVNYVWNIAVQAANVKLGDRVSADTQSIGQVYAHLTVALSKMTESEYDPLWDTVIMTNKKAGLAQYLDVLDRFLLSLAQRFVLTGTNSAIVQSASNETASVVVKVRAKDAKNAFIFPDYALQIKRNNESEPYYEFPLTRKDSWGLVRDWIKVPGEALRESYPSDLTTEIRLVGKLYNRLHEHLSSQVYSQVSGVSGVTFQVNSRVISASMLPDNRDATALVKYPVEITLAHIKKQLDAPYRKGAVLCAFWRHDNLSDYGGDWDTYGCELIATNDTHSICHCTHMTDYAVLLEDYTPPGRMPDWAYYICYVLYGISLILLVVFMFFVLAAERLHYEVHIVHWNCALALFMAICFYLLTLAARDSRLACLAVSVLLHYTYTCAYLWLTICAHYVFRAITSGQLGGRILTWYSYVGWIGPAVIVLLLAVIDISRYGIGDRCLGAHNDYFLWTYIGIFMVFCAMVVPLVIIAAINQPRMIIKDPIDRSDISWSLWGLAIIWPLIFLVWVFAVFIYLIPIDVQVIDWLFELFNSIQGIVFFLAFCVLVPSARLTLMTCARGHGRIRGGFEEEELYPAIDKEDDFISDWSPPTTHAGKETTDIDPVLQQVHKKAKKQKKNNKIGIDG